MSSSTRRLSKIQIWTGRASGSTPSDQVAIEVRPDQAGVPSSTVLATRTSTVVPTASWQGYSFTTALPLAANITYWIVVKWSNSGFISTTATTGLLLTHRLSSDGSNWNAPTSNR